MVRSQNERKNKNIRTPHIKTIGRSPLRLALLLIPLFLLSQVTGAFAGSATWNLNPTNGDWSIAANWTPPTVPNGPADTATFGLSSGTSILVGFGGSIEVNAIVFNAGASAFTISFGNTSFNNLYTISGVGITNNSAITQNFVVADFGDDAALTFKNSATAEDQTVFTAEDSLCHVEFQDTSTAGNSTLIASSFGTIVFTGDSTGDTAAIKLFDGTLDISAHNAPGMSVGSIEGTGTVSLGANNLTVDSNYDGTTFSGVIQDSGAGGSLTKLGRRRLILSNANIYSGGTTIRGGDLFLHNRTGSGTGRGAVKVVAGGLGGDGIIAGPVTIGGSRSRAELLPGDKGVLGTLTFLSTLTFHAHGVYLFDVNSDEAIADQVIAHGVTIRSPSNANFFITDLGPGVLKNAELYDAGNGTWSATGSLHTARSSHTATLLPNGNLLVAGGAAVSLGTSLNSAEIFDPTSGTWSVTGRLATARNVHTATLLPDGKVLVAGGNLGFGPTASAELYDPASGIWTPTGNMTSARYYHTATLLPNGKVLVVGSPGVATAELYDPVSGSWTTTGPPITSRWSHTATLLPNGRVLVAGGSSGIGTPIKLAELYDPATGTWTATGRLVKARQVHTATLLPDDKVLVAGGQGVGIEELTSAELYDPVSGTWTLTGTLAVPRAYHTATLLPNGKVMAAGGNNGINFMEASVELYDPGSGTWTATGSLDPGRYYHTASLLPDGKVLVAGGLGHGLPLGTVFTVISNTSAMPISGTFSNLPDGSTIGIGGKNCQVSYSGGNGNDLTLTVVP